MPSLRWRRPAPAILLLTLCLTGCREGAGNPSKAGSSRTPTLLPSDIEIVYEIPSVDPSASLDSARRAFRDSRTLRPDRRFLLAAAEIKRLAGDKPPLKIHVARESDGWRLHSDGVSIGTLPLLPEFRQARPMLVAWAAARLSPLISSASPVKEIGDLERAASDPFTDGPAATLARLDEYWKGGSRDASFFRVASAASRSLLAQSLDRVGMTDRLDAKALAYLAASEALAGAEPEGAAFLARWTGYFAEADLLARDLPAASPMRIWVEDREEELQRHAEGARASPFMRYLFLLRLAAEKDLEAWGAWLEAHPQSAVDGLPLIRTALSASDFGPDRENAELMLHVLEIEMGADRPSPSVWRDLRRELLRSRVGQSLTQLLALLGRDRVKPEGIVARFEKLLERKVPAGGVFWDPELARVHYRALFYSSLYTLGTFELDRRAWVAGADAFARTLEGAPPGPGDAFAHWFSDLVLFEKDQSRVDELRQDFDTAEIVGRHAVRRIADELLRVIPFNDPRHHVVAMDWTRRLDTRPYERTIQGSNCYAYLMDLVCYETYYGSGAAALGRQQQGTAIGWASHTNDARTLWRLAGADPRASQRWVALEVLARKKLATTEDLVRESAKIFKMDPEASGTHADIAAFLRDLGRYRESEELLRYQIENYPEEEPLSAAYYAARLSAALRGQGRAPEAWTVIEPWIATWKADAIMEGAEVLDALGRRSEGLALARRGLERYPTGPFTRVAVARILWRQGRYAEVPALFQDPSHPPSPSDWEVHIAPSFREVFDESSVEEMSRALQPMFKAGFNPWYMLSFGESFAEIGRYDTALALLLGTTAVLPHIGPLDPRLNVYRYFARTRGEAEAAAWVRSKVPTASRQALMETALIQRLYPLFWLAVGMEATAPEDEEAWLMKAAAIVLDPAPPPEQVKVVRARFSASEGQPSLLGRLLLELPRSDESAAFRGDPGTVRARRALSWGIRALARGEPLAAADWFLTCKELPREASNDRAAMFEEGKARTRAHKFLNQLLRDRQRSDSGIAGKPIRGPAAAKS